MNKSKAAQVSARGRNGRARRFSHRSPTKAQPRELENSIVGIATSGKLAQAARSAIRAQRRAGLAVTYMRDDKIVKEFPNGRRKVIGIVQKSHFELPKGVAKIRRG